MLAVAVTDLVGWDCCENVPFYRAALTAQLADLGVMGWPLADSAVSLPNDLSLQTVAQSWQAPFPENPTEFAQTPGPYVVVHWLRQTVRISPSQMMRSVTAVPPNTLADWLTDQLGRPGPTRCSPMPSGSTYLAGRRRPRCCRSRRRVCCCFVRIRYAQNRPLLF